MKSNTNIARWILFCLLLTALPLIDGCAIGLQTAKITPKSWENPELGKEVAIKINKSVSLEMVYIPGGAFEMGSPKTDHLRRNDEKLVHTVQLDGFWIGKYEITQAQYEAITGENPSKYSGENMPVEKVTWTDAMEFCNQLSAKMGFAFTLPTEAQWEYACRSGTTDVFAFGECLDTSDANYDGNFPLRGCSKGANRNEPWDVGSGKPNAWGLYDMHGNVWEWCLDRYAIDYITDFTGLNPQGPSEGKTRVFRGGCWSSDAGNCRSAARYSASPNASGEIVGFRIVLNDPTVKPVIEE